MQKNLKVFKKIAVLEQTKEKSIEYHFMIIVLKE